MFDAVYQTVMSSCKHCIVLLLISTSCELASPVWHFSLPVHVVLKCIPVLLVSAGAFRGTCWNSGSVQLAALPVGCCIGDIFVLKRVIELQLTNRVSFSSKMRVIELAFCHLSKFWNFCSSFCHHSSSAYLRQYNYPCEICSVT